MRTITSKSTGRTYWIDERGLAHQLDEEFIPDEDGSEAFGRMLERRAESGHWFGRD